MRQYVFKNIIFIVLFSTSFLFAETTLSDQTINKGAKSGSSIMENWQNFADTDIKQPSHNLSSVVVFRPLGAVKGPAVNVYIDGEYQASVLAGAYTQTYFCPGTHRFAIAYTNVLTKYKAKKRVDHKNIFTGNTITYYKIGQDLKGRLKIELMGEEKALALIKKLPPRQRHTISRVNKHKCTQNKVEGR